MHVPSRLMRGARRPRRAAALLLIACTALVVLLGLRASGPNDSAAAASGPTLSIDAAAGQQAISPLIYGMNFADDQGSASEASSIGLPIDRWGGNSTDTYNWQLDSTNLGNDWYFENVADCWNAADSWCNGGNGPNVSAWQQFVAADRAIGAQTLLTLPLVGYVAKNAPLNHPFTCGFPATVFATQDSFDPYDADCGNGQQGGAPLASDPTRDGAATNPASDASGWVSALVARYGTAAHGGVGYYELGNEPALWDSTHRDMHPQPTSYGELWQKSETTAAAVKAVDPSAKVLAFSEWGWPNYFCSATDGDLCTASSPDRAAHGGLPIVAYLLSQAHAYDQAHGGHLFDYLDLHYYAQGGNTTDVTRSLWDPTYTDPSWINTQIDLIPRMRQWVAQYDPGLGLSLSEYNLSVGGAVTNALIQADTLGIFAREGVAIATRWALGNDGPDIVDAFDIYRDYDGHGSRFGDTYVQSQSSNQSAIAVYGAKRTKDGALTVMVINKTASAITSSLSLSGFTPGSAAQRWQWSGAAIGRVADQVVGAGGFSATYPANSITLFVVPLATTTTTTTTTRTTPTTTTTKTTSTTKTTPTTTTTKTTSTTKTTPTTTTTKTTPTTTTTKTTPTTTTTKTTPTTTTTKTTPTTTTTKTTPTTTTTKTTPTTTTTKTTPTTTTTKTTPTTTTTKTTPTTTTTKTTSSTKTTITTKTTPMTTTTKTTPTTTKTTTTATTPRTTTTKATTATTPTSSATTSRAVATNVTSTSSGVQADASSTTTSTTTEVTSVATTSATSTPPTATGTTTATTTSRAPTAIRLVLTRQQLRARALAACDHFRQRARRAKCRAAARRHFPVHAARSGRRSRTRPAAER